MAGIQFTEENRYIIIEALARNGLTLKELANVLSVSLTTIDSWMKDDCRFKDAWMRGRVHPDHLVEQSLFRRAVGYQVEEVVEERGIGGVVLKEKRTVKEIAPSEIACFFWLKNRLPHLWQDSVQHNVTFRDLMDIGAKNELAFQKEKADQLQLEGTVIEAECEEVTNE